MAVRPPTNDSDEPDSIEFGIAALDARISQWDISFPVETTELVETYGEEEIPVTPSGHTVPFRTVLDQCGNQQFDTSQELLNALHPILEAKREKHSGSLLNQLRSLLPF